MLLSEYFPSSFFTGSPVILATDISMTALETAVFAKYTAERVKDLPAQLLKKYFISHDGIIFEVETGIKEAHPF